MNRKQRRKWKKQKMDTLEFARYMDALGDELIEKGLFKKAETRFKHLLEHTPFEDMNEVRDWHEFCGNDLELQLVEARRGTPEEKLYMFQASGDDASALMDYLLKKHGN